MDVYNGDYIDTEGRRLNWPEEFLRKNTETTEIQRLAFTKAVKAGVPIVFATDSGVFPHGLNARQFPIMVARGMTPMQAIQSATRVAAQLHGLERARRHDRADKFGDIIAVKGDPLQGHRGAAERRGGREGRHAVQEMSCAAQSSEILSYSFGIAGIERISMSR